MLNANRMLCREATYFGSWWTTDRPDWTGPVMRGAVDAGDTSIRWRRRIVRPVVRRSLWSVEKILKNDYIAKDAHTKADSARVASSTRWWWSSSLPVAQHTYNNKSVYFKVPSWRTPLHYFRLTWLGQKRSPVQAPSTHSHLSSIYLPGGCWLAGRQPGASDLSANRCSRVAEEVEVVVLGSSWGDCGGIDFEAKYRNLRKPV